MPASLAPLVNGALELTNLKARLGFGSRTLHCMRQGQEGRGGGDALSNAACDSPSSDSGAGRAHGEEPAVSADPEAVACGNGGE